MGELLQLLLQVAVVLQHLQEDVARQVQELYWDMLCQGRKGGSHAAMPVLGKQAQHKYS
jgi:hypothetical protein